MLETRILEVFTNSGLNRQEFAIKIGISNAVMSHISSGRNKASTDLILNILNHFPEISTEWLLLGRGEMILTNKKKLDQDIINDLISQLRDIQDNQNQLLVKIQSLQTYILDLA